MNYPTIITNDSVTVMMDNKPYAFRRGDAQYEGVIKAIQAKRWSELKRILDTPAAIRRESNGRMIVQNDAVFFNGQQVHNVVVDRIIQFKNEGLPFQPLVAFLTRLLKNPHPESINQLYSFLEHEALPITEKGTFLGYKAVERDFKSKTAGNKGHLQYKIGGVVTMDRNEVVFDPQTACGPGLHVGSLQYAKGFAQGDDKIVIVEVDPADCVSVPSDFNHQKLRTCKFKVVAEFKEKLNKPLYRVDNKNHAVTLPKRDGNGRFISKNTQLGVKTEDIKNNCLYRVRGIRRKVFRVIGFNDTKKHGRRAVVSHHKGAPMVLPLWKLRKATKEEVAKYLKKP